MPPFWSTLEASLRLLLPTHVCGEKNNWLSNITTEQSAQY